MTGDISYKITEEGRDYRFNYRVAAIIEAEGKILLHKFVDADYCFLPGGRVQIGETAQEAIMRELEEELDVKIITTSLPFIAENFFEYGAETFHEISLFFRIDGSALKLPTNNEIRGKVQFFWRNGSDIADLNLQPEFLREELGCLPITTKHIVNLGNNFRK